MNAVLDVIEKRRSVRKYADKPLSEEVKNEIIQATLRAPTAGNMMLYSIIEIEDQAIKDRLSVTCDHQPFIAEAPWVLLFLADYQRWWEYYRFCQVKDFCAANGLDYRAPQQGDLLLAVCDALIAAQTAVLAAESMGLGSCYIGDILENYEIHRKLLSLPPYALPVTMVCLGYPLKRNQQHVRTTRFSREFIVFKNKYKMLDDGELKRMFDAQEKRSHEMGWLPDGCDNLGQKNYKEKFSADFSKEMNRSVCAMIKSWVNSEM